MTATSAIHIDGLRKQYPGAFAPAVDGLSLNIPGGSIYGLLGPNGAGKTTTISIICGMIPPDSGQVRVFGKPIDAAGDAIRSRLGVVPQHIALYPGLTGRENIAYIGRLYGITAADIRLRGERLMERLGMSAHAGKRVGRYSGGMKRRMNIIASLLHEPELLILDEPTAGVDVQSRALILDFLKDYRGSGHTVVYTSHLLEEAEQLCDTVAIIDEGRNIIEGTPSELVALTPGCRRLEDVFLHYTGHSVRD